MPIECQMSGESGKMDIFDKCRILGDLWADYREDIRSSEQWLRFFKYNDVALPLAFMVDRDYATMNEESEAPTFIEETWEMFCEYINISPDEEYADLSEAFNASNQPPLAPPDDDDVSEVPTPVVSDTTTAPLQDHGQWVRDRSVALELPDRP